MDTIKSLETPLQGNKIREAVNERIKQLEVKLSETGNKTKKEKKDRQFLEKAIRDSKIFLSLSEGLRVSKPEKGETKLGTITELKVTPGGMPEIWVKWDNQGSSSPENPSILNVIIAEAAPPNGILSEAAPPNGILSEGTPPNGILSEGTPPNGILSEGTPVTKTTRKTASRQDWYKAKAKDALAKLKLKLMNHKNREEEISIQDEIANLNAFLKLSEGLRVSKKEEKGVKQGKIKELKLMPRGTPEVWIIWDNERFSPPEKPIDLVIVEETLQEPDPEPTPEINPEPTPEINPEATPEVNPEATPEIIPEATPEIIPEATPEVNPEPPKLLEQIKVIPLEAIEELSPDEKTRRLHLEQKVEKAIIAFYEAGRALKQIRDERLYRSTHQTFEGYCFDLFGFARRRPYQLIEAAVIVENLLGGHEEDERGKLCTSGTRIIPISERQVRPLCALEDPEEQREAWEAAIVIADPKAPSGEIVKRAVRKIKERKPVPNPWKERDVVEIQSKGNPDLKGKGGAWGVIEDVLDHSCNIKVFDGTCQARIENIKELPYGVAHKEGLRELSDRLNLIYSSSTEEIALKIVEFLGKINRPILTELEENILRLIEEHSQVTGNKLE